MAFVFSFLFIVLVVIFIYFIFWEGGGGDSNECMVTIWMEDPVASSGILDCLGGVTRNHITGREGHCHHHQLIKSELKGAGQIKGEVGCIGKWIALNRPYIFIASIEVCVYIVESI